MGKADLWAGSQGQHLDRALCTQVRPHAALPQPHATTSSFGPMRLI